MNETVFSEALLFVLNGLTLEQRAQLSEDIQSKLLNVNDLTLNEIKGIQVVQEFLNVQESIRFME